MKCKYHNCKNLAGKFFPKNQTEGRSRSFCSDSCKNKYFVDKRRWTLKLKAIAYKGGKCNRCKYAKCPTALDFHHINPDKKEFSISKQPHTRSWERLKTELDKCELLCANCHREEEFLVRSFQKPFLKELLIEMGFIGFDP